VKLAIPFLLLAIFVLVMGWGSTTAASSTRPASTDGAGSYPTTLPPVLTAAW